MNPAKLLAASLFFVALVGNVFASGLQLPRVSPAVAQALQIFLVKREKIAVGGAARTEDVKSVYNAFFQTVDLEKLSATDAAAVVQASAFTFERERAMQLRERLQALADVTAGAESLLAAAASLRLPSRKGEDREKTAALYRRVIVSQELTDFLHSEHAGLVLNVVAGAPKAVALEQRARILEVVPQLDPVASRQAIPVIESYWKAAAKLIDDPAGREDLRLQLVKFVTVALAKRGEDPTSEKSLQRQGEHVLGILNSPMTRGQLIGNEAPPLNFLWANRPGLKTLADLRGKVVVLDFWATWCVPCIESFPKTQELVSFYRDYPVEVVGVTSLQGVIMLPGQKSIDCKEAPEKEFSLLQEFQAAHQISWTLAVSQEPVINPNYGVEGIPAMVILAPDGTVRHARLSPYQSLAEHRKLIDSLLKEFGFKVPPP